MNERVSKLVIPGLVLLAMLCIVLAVGWCINGVARVSDSVATVNGGVQRVLDYAAKPRPGAARDTRQERVIYLPEDGGRWFTTLFLPANWQQDAASRQLVQNFASNPRLLSLKGQTHYWQTTVTDPMVRTKHAYALQSPSPIVTLQDPSGKVWYKASGSNVPSDGDVLADQIAASIAGNPHCPKPKPQPQPDVRPEPKPEIPDTKPAVPNEHFPWLLLILACAASAAVVLVIHFKKPGGLA